MAKQAIFPIIFVAATLIGSAGCSKDSSPTQAQTPATTTQLTAAPSAAVTVTVGTTQTVTISGGTPPYGIGTPPGSIATATLAHAESTVALLMITGVSVATAPTSVTIKDAPSAKTVSISITVH